MWCMLTFPSRCMFSECPIFFSHVWQRDTARPAFKYWWSPSSPSFWPFNFAISKGGAIRRGICEHSEKTLLNMSCKTSHTVFIEMIQLPTLNKHTFNWDDLSSKTCIASCGWWTVNAGTVSCKKSKCRHKINRYTN